MNILITNDDGIHAPGIISLAQRMSQQHNVYVIAPEIEKSGNSHSLTFADPIRISKIQYSEYDGIKAYSADGSPADCVLLGLRGFLDVDIDLVLTGINTGANLGTNISYSGTSNAALEGLICGYPAIALSQMITPDTTDINDVSEYFTAAADIAAQMIEQIDIAAIKEYALNVNFPAVPKELIKGIEVCEQGVNPYDIVFEKAEDTWGREIYWMSSTSNDDDYNRKNQTDVEIIEQGYIAVTPLRWERMHTMAMAPLKCKIDKLKLQF